MSGGSRATQAPEIYRSPHIMHPSILEEAVQGLSSGVKRIHCHTQLSTAVFKKMVIFILDKSTVRKPPHMDKMAANKPRQSSRAPRKKSLVSVS